MHQGPLFAQALEHLRSMEALARETRSPMLASQVAALRQSLLAMAQERTVLDETLALAQRKALRLAKVLKENQRRHEVSLRSFERFRQAHAIAESLGDLDGLPDMLERLATLFEVDLFRLILNEEAFEAYAPLEFPLLSQEGLEAAAAKLQIGGNASYVGLVAGVPLELFGPEGYAAMQSAFAYPLEDRSRPGHMAGIVLVGDARPSRYLPEMATDFMEHFCDTLGHEVVEALDRRKAEELREDVERITRHDLKSPLTAILTLPQFLLESPNLDHRQKEMTRMIMEAGRRMLDMVNRSLTLYRIEQGAYELAKERLDAQALIQAVWEEVGAPYREAGYRLEVVPAGEAFAVTGEELLCHTMLANLIKNAVEASKPHEPVRVELRREPGWAVIAVRNAREVPVELRERFFEKYATAGKSGGTGLGTYSARRIAETHGGSIALDTGQGLGTTVTVRLPDE